MKVFYGGSAIVPPGARERPTRLRRRLALAALLLALIPATVVAAEIVSGDQIVISDPVEGDLYLLGSDIIIDAPVNGDVLAAAGRIQILAPVTGSVHAFSGDVIIRADVGGSVMAAGSSVIIAADIGHAVRAAASDVIVESGSIDGDLVVAATRLRLGEAGVVAGEVIMRVTNADLAGSMRGGLRGSVRDLRVSGTLGDASDIRVNTLRFTPGADVREPFTYTSDHEMLVDGGTSITAQVTRITPDHPSFGETIARSLLFAVFRFGWAFATGWLLLRVIPETVIGISDTLRLAPARSLLWGLAALFGIPVVALVVAITVIGIPIAIVTLVLYVFVLYASQIVVGMVIGMALSRSRWKCGDGSPAYLRMLAAGLAIIVLIRSLPLDGWYPLVSFVTATIALGAIVVYFFRPRPEEPAELSAA
ncbi:MAG TPA: hypothetical protein VMM78_06035 [Thermomicrobiales bacterium]|nr:hypothetical protein [Thermomicrobiales bacterium]